MQNFVENKLLSPGEAKFEIMQVWDKDKEGKPLVSKAGNPMLRLKLLVTDKNGDQATVWDYILLNSLKKMIALLMAIGKVEWQERIIQNNFGFEALINQAGRCTIKTDAHELYGAKTVVEWYLKLKPPVKDNTLTQQIDSYKSSGSPKSEAVIDSYPF